MPSPHTPLALHSARVALELLVDCFADAPEAQTLILCERPGGGGLVLPLDGGDGSAAQTEHFARVVLGAVRSTPCRVVLGSWRDGNPLTIAEADLAAWRRLRAAFAPTAARLLDWFVLDHAGFARSLAETTAPPTLWHLASDVASDA